jgi:SAM-dependent methyltransferase
MELRRLYPQIELFGINKKPWVAMRGQKSLKVAGVYYKIFTKKEINKIRLPRILFYDAIKLNFPSNHFDIIYSQVALPYFTRKDSFLEETWRTLKKGGIALIHIDAISEDYPDFLPGPTPRFVIRQGKKNFPFAYLVRKIKNKGFDLKCFFKSRTNSKTSFGTYLILKKNTSKKLKLPLKFQENNSFELNELDPKKKKTDVYWGFRSVYKLR